MDNTLEEAKAILKKYNQEHLLNGYEKLEEKKQKQLLNQIMNIDFELIKSLYDNTKKENSTNDDKIEPMEYLDKYKLNDKYKYKEIKLYLVTSAYGKALGQKNYQSYIELLRKINQKDTLTNDWTLSNKLFKFQKRILRIEREIPPNPVIKRIT